MKHDLEGLKVHPGWLHVKRLAQKKIEASAYKMQLGNLGDYAEYREVVGFLEGIRYVLSLPADELRKLEKKT